MHGVQKRGGVSNHQRAAHEWIQANAVPVHEAVATCFDGIEKRQHYIHIGWRQPLHSRTLARCAPTPSRTPPCLVPARILTNPIAR